MPGQILTISSHVVHGYVGNRGMTFPLQVMGWNVDALNTTNYSNHPGYGSFSGEIEKPQLIFDVLKGLQDIGNGIENYDILITGYLPNYEIITSVKNMMDDLSDTKKPVIVMDPILGDNGKLYLSEAVVPVYKEILASGKIDVITPNQFEFEYFTGVKITDETTLKQAITKFKSLYNVKHIVISSVNFDDSMYCVGYVDDLILIPIEEIPVKFFGCGDLFTALMAHNFVKYDFEHALKDSVEKLSKVLQRTVEHEPGVKIIKDLRIIQLKDIYLQ